MAQQGMDPIEQLCRVLEPSSGSHLDASESNQLVVKPISDVNSLGSI